MKKDIDWRNGYEAERNERIGLACATRCEDPHLTQQQFRDDADMNVIASRFGLDKHPVVPALADARDYGDFTGSPDLRTVLETVRTAKDHFMALDPKLRARFHNDPAELWDFIRDPDNSDEAVRLGLLARIPPASPAESAVPRGNEAAAGTGGETGTSIS